MLLSSVQLQGNFEMHLFCLSHQSVCTWDPASAVLTTVSLRAHSGSGFSSVSSLLKTSYLHPSACLKLYFLQDPALTKAYYHIL